MNTSSLPTTLARHGAMMSPSASKAKGRLLISNEVFLQRSARVFTEFFAPDKTNREKPKELWGMPKVVWAVLATVLAMVIFLACIPVVL